MKKFFLFLTAVILFSSCVKEGDIYYMDQNTTEKVVLGQLMQIETGTTPVFKLQYSNNTFEGGTLIVKIADDTGNVVSWGGQKILLHESGEIYLGNENYPNIFNNIVRGEQYYFVFFNNENNTPVYTISVDNGNNFNENGIIPFVLL